jgi:hypothetical protein
MTWLPTGYAGLVLGVVAVALTIGLALTVVPARRPRTSPISALGRLRGWHVVDDVAVDSVEIDHVVVAPAAVLAIVTENHTPERHPDRDLDAAERAAARVREFLRMRRAGDTVVVPVVWVSGPEAPSIDGGHRLVAGVHVVDGENPAAWLHVFREARLAGVQRLELCRELDAAVPPRSTAARSIRHVRPPAADAA